MDQHPGKYSNIRKITLAIVPVILLHCAAISQDTTSEDAVAPVRTARSISVLQPVKLVPYDNGDTESVAMTAGDTLTVLIAPQTIRLEDEVMDATPVLKVIAVILGLITLVLTYFGYRLNVQGSKLARTQWYAQLFTKFYEETTYKDMRRRLDFKDPVEMKELTDSLERDSREKLSEDFYDYLTFFEFMATLEASKQITLPEMLNLFRYYLNDINQQPFIRSSLPKNDFKLLTALLVRLEDQGELDPAPPPISQPEKEAS